MSARTTTAVQRVDMLLAQAERFAELKAEEEAFARARQVIAYAERESARDPSLTDALRMRALLAESLIRRLGRTVRNVDASDAAVPRAWD
jgi:predicted Zn-dependent peptidase